MCVLTNVDVRKMTVSSLTNRLVEFPKINAQQIEPIQRSLERLNRYNVLSKNTTKELVTHEYARPVCGVVKLLVDGGVGTLCLESPEEIGWVGGGSHDVGVTGGGEKEEEENREEEEEDECEEGGGGGKGAHLNQSNRYCEARAKLGSSDALDVALEQGLTMEMVGYSAWGPGWVSSEPARRWEDDERLVGSTFSRVSMIPTPHTVRRSEDRVIPEEDIKKTKAQGKLTLSIHFNDQEDTNDVKDEISWQGGRFKETFEQLEVGDVIEKGREDGRLEVELHGSEKLCSEIKEWLKGQTTSGKRRSRARI